VNLIDVSANSHALDGITFRFATLGIPSAKGLLIDPPGTYQSAVLLPRRGVLEGTFWLGCDTRGNIARTMLEKAATGRTKVTRHALDLNFDLVGKALATVRFRVLQRAQVNPK